MAFSMASEFEKPESGCSVDAKVQAGSMLIVTLHASMTLAAPWKCIDTTRRTKTWVQNLENCPPIGITLS